MSLGDFGTFLMKWYNILTGNVRLTLFIVVMDMTSAATEINSLILWHYLHSEIINYSVSFRVTLVAH